MSTVLIPSLEFKDFLSASFTPSEWYGLLCRSFGPKSTEYPLLIAQEAYMIQSIETICSKPIPRYFFEELLLLRPQGHKIIKQCAADLNVVLRKRPMAKSSLSIPSSGTNRFRPSKIKNVFIDLFTNEPHYRFTKDVSHFQGDEVQHIFEDILSVSQLPNESLQRVTDVQTFEQVIHIYSKMCGESFEEYGNVIDPENMLFLLVKALDSAHQRDVYHGPIEKHHLRHIRGAGLVLGGFGEYDLSGETADLQSDFAAVGDAIERFFSKSILLEELCSDLRSGEWIGDILGVCDAVSQTITDSDMLPLQKRTPKMHVVDHKPLKYFLWFQPVTDKIVLQKKGEGNLELSFNELPSWLDVFPNKIAPDVFEQTLEITVSPKTLSKSDTHFDLKLIGAEHTTVVEIRAKKGNWIMPLLFIVSLISLIGIMMLVRAAG